MITFVASFNEILGIIVLKVRILLLLLLLAASPEFMKNHLTLFIVRGKSLRNYRNLTSRNRIILFHKSQNRLNFAP